jgi:SAM-dependent methyltransferase
VGPLLPVRVKRTVKRLLPGRFYRYVDPGWHRKAVGGMWEELGRLQLDFLVGQGLRPDHSFLDVGCGSLRGGVHFIRYLDAGRYYGFDRSPERLAAGRDVELPRYGLVDKRPVLEVIDDFGVERFGRAFDFALAQSVFTHIPLDVIELCLQNVGEVLAPGGRLYATFNERSDASADHVDRSELPYGKDPIVRYDFSAFEELCRGGPLSVDYIGEWGHPRGQKMLVFTKGPPAGA